MKKNLLLCALAAGAVGAAAENIPNPLLPNVADVGVMKYNGKYYLGGCRTDGDFYVTSDLVHWTGPVHVIDMDNDWSRGTSCGNNQIHSNDMLYDNGTVHAYWSVNHWGRDLHAVHVVHSEASDPMGPYAEPVRDRWMDNRIDPKVFRDDDGQLYMYMVRFTDGNTIWARKMNNWREFNETDPDAMLCQFSSNPGTWERMDNAVAEGPWVIKYHNKYYMMYNANHTDGEWGNYQLGVAQAQQPMGFNNGNKYSHPVVGSNQDYVDITYPDLLRFTSKGDYNPQFAYSTDPSDKGEAWTAPDFNDSAWERGLGGFASRAERGTSVHTRGTYWDTDRLRLRKPFTVADTRRNLALRLTTKGATRVWLNGKEIYTTDKGEYRVIPLTPEMKRHLRKGTNLLAIETAKSRRGNYVNAQLFDTGRDTLDPEIVWTPGQPNILRGPNGFDWWLIYMANNGYEGRSQYIDRVYFHGDKMVVDGITHRNNSGIHPAPSPATYSDTFDDPKLPRRTWGRIDPTNWRISDGELRVQPSPATDREWAVLSPRMAAESYLWEVNVKPQGTAGVYAAYVDADNNVEVVFDRPTSSWVIVETLGGTRRTVASTPLRPDFRWDAYHQLRVERDHTDLVVSVDEMRTATPFTISLGQAAMPGLISVGAPAAFDGVIYTIGFDDGNDRMNSWRTLSGALSPTPRGATASGALTATKGTPSKSYEFAAQISHLGTNAVAGIYPLYIDANNYILAQLDATAHALKVTAVRNGKTEQQLSLPLECWRTLYADQRFTDFVEKGYTFDVPTLFDAIYLPRYDVSNRNLFNDAQLNAANPTIGNRETVRDNMFALMTPSVVAPDGSWKQLPVDNAAIYTPNPAYNEAHFPPVRASRMRFINNTPTDTEHHIYRIGVHELFKDSYNLRVLRLPDGNLHLFVDGRHMATLPTAPYGPSLVGLSSTVGTPEYHGITYFHR